MHYKTKNIKTLESIVCSLKTCYRPSIMRIIPEWNTCTAYQREKIKLMTKFCSLKIVVKLILEYISINSWENCTSKMGNRNLKLLTVFVSLIR